MKALVMCDLDGTIYFAHSEVRPSGFAPGIESVFSALWSMDVGATINTARHPRTARALAGALGVRTPYGCLTGGAILGPPPLDPAVQYLPSIPAPQEILQQSEMTVESVARVVRLAREVGLGARVFCPEDVYLFGPQELYAKWPEDRELERPEDLPARPLQMFVTGRRDEQFHALTARLSQWEEEISFYAFRHRDGFEIAVNPSGVTKARLVDFYIRERALRREQIVAIGDSPGDLPMIRAAGVGVATALAPDHVKAEADVVLEDASLHAVPDYLRRHFGL